jgi:hypothetical protein
MIKRFFERIRCKYDLHDYCDDVKYKVPMHFYKYTCERCGKEFGI